MGGLSIGVLFASVIAYVSSTKVQSQAEDTSLREDFDLLGAASSKALPFVSPSGLGTWTFASTSSITSTGTETALQWTTASNSVRVGNTFTSGSGANYGLPAIGPAGGSCLVTPCSEEGVPDNQSVAIHPGNSDTQNVVVKFTATVNVVVSGYVKELGAHCGGINVYFYNDAAMIANKIALNDDNAFQLNHTGVAAGSSARVIINRNGKYSCDQSSISLAIERAVTPSAVGDPHLTNLRGERFDIHDGTHRLVHYPRTVPESEALLVLDARAIDMGRNSNCYSVYLDSVKIFGKWVGEEISISANSSAASSSKGAFSMLFASEQMDWTTLSEHNDFHPKLNGMMPVTVTTGMRKASGEDALGGEVVTFKIGNEHPVLIQVWSSHGKNQLTDDKEVRYLNIEVQNLPKSSGGIIGQDSYSRPSESRCDLIQEERDLLQYAETDAVDVSLLRLPRPKWTASAIVQQ